MLSVSLILEVVQILWRKPAANIVALRKLSRPTTVSEARWRVLKVRFKLAQHELILGLPLIGN